MTTGRYRSELLSGLHNRKAFSCGVEALDRYLHQQARQDYRRGVAVPYVLTDISTGEMVGYYTLSALSVLPESLPAELTARLPRYDAFPAILLGRLAVDQRHRGQGVGQLLLFDALARSLAVSKEIGALAVVVQAKDEDAYAFYKRHGFLPFEDHEDRLYMLMATIATLGILLTIPRLRAGSTGYLRPPRPCGRRNR
ncbi:MAG: GNAT family N-acetyltransferase [Dehalococcoidia bacterium]|nr:GNAT family N-acetyltransferase [Dehalococcoidia bacterium]